MLERFLNVPAAQSNESNEAYAMAWRPNGARPLAQSLAQATLTPKAPKPKK